MGKKLTKYIVPIENRIYIRVEFSQSFGMNFFSPFHVNVHKLYAVEYNNTV